MPTQQISTSLGPGLETGPLRTVLRVESFVTRMTGGRSCHPPSSAHQSSAVVQTDSSPGDLVHR
jgi:hypothetical protein